MTDRSPQPAEPPVYFWRDFSRGVAWGLGVGTGLFILILLCALLALLVLTGGDDKPYCSPDLPGYGLCDGQPGALSAWPDPVNPA